MTREEAIERIKARFDKLALDDKDTKAIETLIPELKESEDERIRKELIAILKKSYNVGGFTLNNKKDLDGYLAYLEKQKEQNPIKMEVYEVGKGTTICGQDYKCKKDYKEGNCWYIKDVIYHCNRDGYLNDQNGVSWSCTPEWFKEYIYSNAEWAEKEKSEFVGGQFIQCNCTLDNGLKKGEHYWLEYVGDDTYVGRSDNILNQKFHITPRQLFTLFTQQLEEKQKEQIPYTDFVIKPHKGDDTNPYDMSASEAQKYAIKRGFGIPLIDGEVYVDERHITQTISNILRWADEHPKEQKPVAWGEDDDIPFNNVLNGLKYAYEDLTNHKSYDSAKDVKEAYDWMVSRFKYFCPNLQPKQEWSEEDETIIDCAVEVVEKAGLPSLAASLKSLKSHWKPSEKKYDGNMDKKEITEETIAMNERLKKFKRETKSSLILSKMKCKGFRYNVDKN